MMRATRRRIEALERDMRGLKRQAASSRSDAGRLRRMTGQILDGRPHAGDARTLDAIERAFEHRSPA